MQPRRISKSQGHKKGEQNADANTSTRLHLPPRFHRGELARKKFLTIAKLNRLTYSKTNHFVEALLKSSEIVGHGSVKTTALPKLRRAHADATAVAEFVDVIEQVNNIEPDLERTDFWDL